MLKQMKLFVFSLACICLHGAMVAIDFSSEAEIQVVDMPELLRLARAHGFSDKQHTELPLSKQEQAGLRLFYFENRPYSLLLYATPWLISALSLITHDAIEGDIFTGNPYIEGSNETTLVAIKINKSLQQKLNLSLEELHAVFKNLRADITLRTHYLSHREDRFLILETLKSREARLINNLEAVERCVLHFRQHAQLKKYMDSITVISAITAPILTLLLFAMSFDFSSKTWDTPDQGQLQTNLDFLVNKLDLL